MKKLYMLAVVASVSAVSAVSAESTPLQSTPVVRLQAVSYSDIDLGTKKGATELKRRVRTALQNICGNASPANLIAQNQANRCYRENKQRTTVAASAAISRATLRSETQIAGNR